MEYKATQENMMEAYRALVSAKSALDKRVQDPRDGSINEAVLGITCTVALEAVRLYKIATTIAFQESQPIKPSELEEQALEIVKSLDRSCFDKTARLMQEAGYS